MQFDWGGPAYCGEQNHLLPAEVTLYLFYSISLSAQQYLPLETVCTTEGTTDTQIQALIIPVTSHHKGWYIYLHLHILSVQHFSKQLFSLTATEDMSALWLLIQQ